MLEPCQLTRRGFHKAALGEKNQGRMIFLITVTKQQTSSWMNMGKHTKDTEFNIVHGRTEGGNKEKKPSFYDMSWEVEIEIISTKVREYQFNVCFPKNTVACGNQAMGSQQKPRTPYYLFSVSTTLTFVFLAWLRLFSWHCHSVQAMCWARWVYPTMQLEGLGARFMDRIVGMPSPWNLKTG